MSTTTSNQLRTELPVGATLQEQARRHLWMHFTRMGEYSDTQEIPIIVRGEGCYVYDEHGNRYLDGLASLFCSNIGHGRADVAQAGADQAKELGYFSSWSYAHPPHDRACDPDRGARARRSQSRVLHQQRQRGGRVGAEALRASTTSSPGNPNKYKVIAREIAYHGTTLGALSATGITELPSAVRAAAAGRLPRAQHQHSTGCPQGTIRSELAEAVAHRIEFEGPDTVAAVIMEPVQNAGGCLVPPDGYFDRVREICDEYDVLLISDEVICAWGRLGDWFGSERIGYQPDIITTAKGLTSAYAPMGAVIASDRVAEPFMEGSNTFLHGRDLGRASDRRRRSRSPTSTCSRTRTCSVTCAPTRAPSSQMLQSLSDLPIVGDVRGLGYFYAIELVKDKETKESFSDEESETLLRGYLSGEMFRRGLICRSDDRGDPVMQLSPPLIAGQEQFDEIEADPAARCSQEAGRRHAGPVLQRRHSTADVDSTEGPGSHVLTVRELIADLDVRLLAGESRPRPADSLGPHVRAARPDAVAVRWRGAAHAPACSSTRPERQREFIELLADHQLAGLGFGTGFGHEQVPEALLEAAARASTSRSSRSRTSCRSSRSPRPPSPSS